MEEESEYHKLPIEERCQHKLWKARVHGYEAATKLFNDITDQKSAEWSKYLGLVKKFVSDSNVVAQEKALDAVLAYVENASCAGKTCGEVMSGIVNKCLGGPKAKTKEKSIAIILMYVEIEKQEIVQDELMKGLSIKNPKVVIACIQALRESLREFGPKIILPKPLIKQIPTLLEDRDKGVREETKLLAIEVYRWIGPALKPQLSSLKPVQLTELEAEFEKLGTSKITPSRYVRSQQELQAKAKQMQNEAADEDEDENDEIEKEEIDPSELIEPVNILSQLSSDFYEKCDAKKWQERKEAMDALLVLASNPKLETGDYSDLVRVLKKIIGKDSNVVVIATAGKCLAGLANGLKNKFHPYSVQCIQVILEKFKEKKQNVVQALREAIDAIYPSTTLESIQEDVLAALDNKNPSVKAETTAFVTRCFTHCSPQILNKKLLKGFCTSLLKTLNDTDPGVRDNSAEALGTAMKVVGDKNILPFIQEVEALKMTKIRECCDKAVIVLPKVKGPKCSKPPSATSSLPNPKSDPKPIATSKKPSSRISTAKTNKRPLTSRGGKLRAGGCGNKGKAGASESPPSHSDTIEKEISVDDAKEILISLLPSKLYDDLVDSTWKTRLSALEQLLNIFKIMEHDQVPTQAILQAIARKPGFKDTNFQVLKLKFEIVLFLATECSFSRCSALLCVAELADKLGDPKNGTLAAETLMAVAESTKFDFVTGQVLESVFGQKNPKTHAEALNWLSNATKEFGLQFQVKSVLEYIKKGLAATNPAVRAAAINLLGTMYLYIGPSLRTFFDNEKAALLQQIDGEFEKLQGMIPPQPTRGLAFKNKGTNDDDDSVMGDGVPPVINVADLIPRTDICDLISSELLENLADKNWKVRGEALQRLATIVSDAKFITPNLGGLPTILKSRLNDSNKNLAIQSLNICQAIGTAMGPNCTKHVRTLAPGIIIPLGDSKSLVRTAALNCLNAWVEQCGISPFVEGDTLSDSLKLENPSLRAELLSWLAEKLAAVKTVSPDLTLCVLHLYACLEDRNGDVRKNAQEAVVPFMIHLGCDKMFQMSKKLKPASKTTVGAILEKAKQNLPARPQPKPRQVSATGAKSSANIKYQDDETGDTNTGAAKGMKRATSKNKLSGNVKVGKKNDEEEKSPPMQQNNIKEQRLLDEQRLKVLKWNFTTPRDEFYDQLRDQMAVAGFSSTLQTYLFHSDFKFHIKAIDTFMECLENPHVSISNLDLILKWLALRFFDTNPSVLLKGLEYLKQLFIQLSDNDYQLLEYEANLFIPYLILKVGDPKDTVRQSVRNIFKLISDIYSASKLFLFIMEGLKSKNARQRTECLELLASLIEMFGVNVGNSYADKSHGAHGALKEISKHISDRDNSVRNAALNCIVQAYFLDGEKIYKYLGPIPDRELCLLEERIKRASRNRVVIPKPTNANTHVNSKPPQIVQQADNQKKDDLDITIVKRNNAAGNNAPQTRPVSGVFSLDLDKIEAMMDEKNEHDFPKLVKPDLDEILSKPIMLPETRMRPPSPATKLLMLSADAASALDLVISQIASNDTVVTVNALVQIDEFLKDDSRCTLMTSRVDQLLLAESLQYRMTYTRHIDNESTRKQVLKLYRCLTMTLVTMFNHENLAKKASADVLKDLLYNLVAVLLDDRLSTIDEGPQVIRSLNVLVVAIIDRADPSKVLCAVIKLLHDCIASESCSSRFIEVILKCHWKLLRMIPPAIDDLDLDHILFEIHLFLRAFPSPSWRRRTSDLPLRTIKTVMHTLVEHAGNRVMSHLKMIENLQDSEMEMYLQKLLRRTSVRHSRVSSDVAGRENRNTSKREAKNHRRLSKNTHEMLAEIFKKIGAKEYTKEGLIDLYNFKKSHPEADIAPFLLRSSQFFQDYIERGLRTIETEHETNVGSTVTVTSSQSIVTQSVENLQNMPTADGILTSTTTTVTTTRGTSGEYVTTVAEDFNPSMYMERLKALRARCGYDNSKYDNSAMIKSATPPEPVSTTESKLETQILMQGMQRSESSDAVSGLSKSNMDVDDLRQRLERIKNSKN